MSKTPPEKILFVMPRWVGDAVMAAPLLESVHQAWPNAEKHLLIKRYLGGLLRDAPWADREIVIEPDTSFWSLRRRLARERYDVGILLPNSLRPALLLCAARVRQRVGYRRNGRAPLLTGGLPFPKERPFRMVDFYGRLAVPLGLDAPRAAPKLYVADDDRKAAAALLERHGLDLDATLVGVNPGAKYGSSKLWPTTHFATAADDVIRRTGASIVLLAGPGEDELAADIARRMAGRATVLPSAEVDLVMLKAVLGHLDLLLSNDTGPRHIAAAVGVPTVTVFGPTHATWGENEHPIGIDVKITVDCGPCMQRTCPEGHHRCMTDLGPDQVAEAAVRLLLGRTGGRTGGRSEPAGRGDSGGSAPIVDITLDRHPCAGDQTVAKQLSLKILEKPVEVLAPGSPGSCGTAPDAGGESTVLESKHDFAAKFRQQDVLDRLKDYVRRQARLRREHTLHGGEHDAVDWHEVTPDQAPVSINLDITTACNYACDHCVDKDILNKPIKYDHENLLASLTNLAARGLKSVIVIGGGEPTVYPQFSEAVRHMKSLGLQVSVVSNGSGNMKIVEVADCLEAGDWVRLSLDSAYDDTFTAMHKPKRPITLDQICSPVHGIKTINDTFDFGYSYIITWKGATINDSLIVENLHEIVPAAERAKQFGFDYISFKPFLTRAPENNAEIVDLDASRAHFAETMDRIRASVAEAKKLETDRFKVLESTNLRMMEGGKQADYQNQPQTCHMQYFRQVLSPLGIYNCPVYRNQPHGRINDKEGYAPGRMDESLANTAKLIQSFDASVQCKEVTCLYNHVNWWIEDLIANEHKLDDIADDWTREPDFFF